MGKRASIFNDEHDSSLNVNAFGPKVAVDMTAPSADDVKMVSEAAHFRSRESSSAKPVSPDKRMPRRYRTGRNVQFNVKALKETVDAFYALSEAQGWVLGYTLERAIEALQRDLGNAE